MRTRIGLISLFLMLSATACNSITPVQLEPSAELLADCPETPVALVVNSDMPKAIRSLRSDLRRCNADKAALRAFYATEAE